MNILKTRNRSPLASAILISAEVFGAAFAGGWAFGNLFALIPGFPPAPFLGLAGLMGRAARKKG